MRAVFGQVNDAVLNERERLPRNFENAVAHYRRAGIHAENDFFGRLHWCQHRHIGLSRIVRLKFTNHP